MSHGKPLSAVALSRRLKPFRIAPRTVRTGQSTSKGYLRDMFTDAWSRYLPKSSLVEAAEPLQPSQTTIDAGKAEDRQPSHGAAVTAAKTEQEPVFTHVVTAVTPANVPQGAEMEMMEGEV